MRNSFCIIVLRNRIFYFAAKKSERAERNLQGVLWASSYCIHFKPLSEFPQAQVPLAVANGVYSNNRSNRSPYDQLLIWDWTMVQVTENVHTEYTNTASRCFCVLQTVGVESCRAPSVAEEPINEFSMRAKWVCFWTIFRTIVPQEDSNRNLVYRRQLLWKLGSPLHWPGWRHQRWCRLILSTFNALKCWAKPGPGKIVAMWISNHPEICSCVNVLYVRITRSPQNGAKASFSCCSERE